MYFGLFWHMSPGFLKQIFCKWILGQKDSSRGSLWYNIGRNREQKCVTFSFTQQIADGSPTLQRWLGQRGSRKTRRSRCGRRRWHPLLLKRSVGTRNDQQLITDGNCIEMFVWYDFIWKLRGKASNHLKSSQESQVEQAVSQQIRISNDGSWQQSWNDSNHYIWLVDFD